MGTMVRKESIRALVEASREEAAKLVRTAAEPPLVGDTIKTTIARAASRLGWDFNRTQDIWRKEARRIDAFEMDQLRQLNGVTLTQRARPKKASENKESGGKLRRKKQN